MKLLVFSDIHGNSYALEAFFSKIETMEYDRLIFCGDIFGYYYNQRQILEKLSDRKDLIWLKGNHDEFFLNLYRGKAKKEYYIRQYGHSYDCLQERYREEDFALISSHSSSYLLQEQNCRIGIFHGTPEDSLNGRLYPDNSISNPSVYQDYDIVILGHTHCRMVRTEGSTLIVNPGSLGQPRDGSGYGFAVIDTGYKTVAFHNVIINQAALYRQIDKYDPDLKKLKEVLERRI